MTYVINTDLLYLGLDVMVVVESGKTPADVAENIANCLLRKPYKSAEEAQTALDNFRKNCKYKGEHYEIDEESLMVCELSKTAERFIEKSQYGMLEILNKAECAELRKILG